MKSHALSSLNNSRVTVNLVSTLIMSYCLSSYISHKPGISKNYVFIILNSKFNFIFFTSLLTSPAPIQVPAWLCGFYHQLLWSPAKMLANPLSRIGLSGQNQVLLLKQKSSGSLRTTQNYCQSQPQPEFKLGLKWFQSQLI